MAVLIANPNSTGAMTDAMLAAARTAAPDLDFAGWTSPDGPPAIQGREDGAAAVPPLLEMIASDAGGTADAIVIGCFDDTGLARAARLAPCPVIGIGQTAFHLAALRKWRFGVVTTLQVSVPILTGNIAAYGLARLSTGVRAAGVPVLDLDRAPADAIAPILAQARAAIAEDGAEAIILGCAGMVHVAEALRQALSVPVIDPVEAAAGAAAWLLRAPG